VARAYHVFELWTRHLKNFRCALTLFAILQCKVVTFWRHRRGRKYYLHLSKNLVSFIAVDFKKKLVHNWQLQLTTQNTTAYFFWPTLYVHTKNELSGSTFSKVRALQHDWQHYLVAFAGGNHVDLSKGSVDHVQQCDILTAWIAVAYYTSDI